MKADHRPRNPDERLYPTMLSNGEFVINAAATKKHRAILEAINSGKAPAMSGWANTKSLNQVYSPSLSINESTSREAPVSHLKMPHSPR